MKNFNKTCDCDTCIKFISAAPMTDSDWPVWFIIKLEYTEHWGDDPTTKYYVSIQAVAPDACAGNHESAAGCVGYSPEEFKKFDPAVQAEILADYGLAPTLWSKYGNNKGSLLTAARKEIDLIGILFGFYMDKPQNAIGSDGWDWIKGDMLRPIRSS